MGKIFTIREDTYIRNNYLSLTDRMMAEHLGRSSKSIKNHRHTTGLVKPNGFGIRKRVKSAKSRIRGRVGKCSVRKEKGGRMLRYICVAPGQWQKEHYLNWLAQHGPLPPNTFLRCRTADTLNTDPANWQPVTRQQHFHLAKSQADRQQTNRKNSITHKELWRKVKTMEANGLKPRCKYRSVQKARTSRPNIPVWNHINTTAGFDFY